MAWRNKKIKKWSNKDLCDWVKSIGLSEKWEETMIKAIKSAGCTGQDLTRLKNGNDLANILDIKPSMITNRTYREFKKMKDEQVKSLISKAASRICYGSSDKGGMNQTGVDVEEKLNVKVGSNKYHFYTVSKGMNYVGKCETYNCKAYGEPICFARGIDENGFNPIDENMEEIPICPGCKKHFELKSYALYKCDCKIMFKKKGEKKKKLIYEPRGANVVFLGKKKGSNGLVELAPTAVYEYFKIWVYTQNTFNPQKISNGFDLQIFGMNKYWTIQQKATQNTTIRTVKELFKETSGCDRAIDDIIIISKAKECSDYYTLRQIGIADGRHLMTVKFKEKQELKNQNDGNEDPFGLFKGFDNYKNDFKAKQQEQTILNDTQNYEQWDDCNVADWICNLENKRFKQYEKVLRVKLKEEGIRGDDIGDLDKNDLHRIGIINFSDKKALLKHIQNLIS